MDKKRVFNGWMFLLALVAVVWIKGANAKAQEFPTLVPDGDYVTSTVTEYQDTDYSCSFKLIIENAGYYYFKEKTEDDTWWIVKSKLNADSWWFGESVWYLEEGTYYIGPETYSSNGYPCVKVYSAECEFDLSKVQTSFETTNLVYSSNDVLRQWTDNVKVKVSLSDGASFTTSLEGVWLRPVLYKNGKTLYAIGNTDFDKQEYVTGGDYEVRIMNYVESYCQDSRDINIKTCSISNIPETRFDKDMKVNEHDKFALTVTKPSYILVKNIYDLIFVDSDGNLMKPNNIDYRELASSKEVLDEDGDLYTKNTYNHYKYIYISNPQKLYVEVMEVDEDSDSAVNNVAFYQMHESMIKTKDVSDSKYYDEFLYNRFERMLSCYDIKFESEAGKVLQYSPEMDEFDIMIDEKKWEEYRDENYKIKISEGMHKASFIMPNGTEMLNFNFELSGSIKQDDEIEVYGNNGEINVNAGEIKYIKIKPDHAGKFILIDYSTINSDDKSKEEYVGYCEYFEDGEFCQNSTTVCLNEQREMQANDELFVEVDNTEGNVSQIVYAEILEQKITKLPEAIQNIDGSKKAGWLLDKLNKEIEFTMKTSMGDYKLDLNIWWGYSPKLVFANSIYAGYEVSPNSALFDGNKYYYVIENLLKYEITIKDTSKKENQAAQQQSKKIDVGTTIKTTDVTYKITNNKAGKVTVSYQAPVNTKKTNYSIPDTVKLLDGTIAKVTEIVPNAFKKCKKIKKVSIGKNVEKIGKNAFNGCKNLKTIKIKSAKLTKKSFGKNSFKGINKKATVTVPKKVYKNYKKWLKNTGVPKSVKIKK